MQDLIFSIFPTENFVDLGLFQFGREKCAPSHLFGPAKRNHFLFHYVISGMGTLVADDSKGNHVNYRVKSREGFLIIPNQTATYYADYEVPWEYCWIEFDGLRAKGFLESAGLSGDSPIYHARHNDLREDMVREMLYITENSSLPPLHLIGHLYLFLDYLMRSSASQKIQSGSQLRDFYIHEALEYIEHNFQNDITVEDIAAVCGLNRSYFGKIFKKTVGKTPQEFLLSYRMSKAAELMKLTELSIGDIGLAVGYSSPLHFSRAFKNTYGLSPREWRNQNKLVIKS